MKNLERMLNKDVAIHFLLDCFILSITCYPINNLILVSNCGPTLYYMYTWVIQKYVRLIIPPLFGLQFHCVCIMLGFQWNSILYYWFYETKIFSIFVSKLMLQVGLNFFSDLHIFRTFIKLSQTAPETLVAIFLNLF